MESPREIIHMVMRSTEGEKCTGTWASYNSTSGEGGKKMKQLMVKQ